jgi:signal transduction histidine kinase
VRLRLHHQLALPFAAVAVAATVLATWVAVREVRQWLDQHRAADAATAAAVLSRTEYATNPALLRIAADLAGVEVVTLALDGRVIASSFEDEVPSTVMALVPERSVSRQATTCGVGCAMHVVPVAVPDSPGARMMVVAGRGVIDPFTEATVRSIWLAALAGLVLLVAISHWLARVLTSRIERLVDVTNEVTPGQSLRAVEGSDDIGRLGAAFNQMLDRLEEHRHALMRSEKLAVAGLMAARVAHDVRNPLSSIKLRTQLLLGQGAHTDDTVESLRTVLRDIGQLEAVVSDLLETARPEAPQVEPCKLPELVRTAAEPFVAPLAHRRITLTVSTDDAAPEAFVDRRRLHRALVNLLTNAAEATRAGGAITVTTRMSAGAHVIEVADDGVGIAPGLETRLFDPFVSDKPEGIGLGLVNVKAIVDSHHGTVKIERRVPRGTIVCVTLPIQAAEPGVPDHG